MKSWRTGNEDVGYIFKNSSIRCQLLKILHCRGMLIFVSVLVILECLCVMAELSVDLHSLRVRFDHEELELQKFVNEIRTSSMPASIDINSISDLIEFLKASDRDKPDLCECNEDQNEIVEEGSDFAKHTIDKLNLIIGRKSKFRQNIETDALHKTIKRGQQDHFQDHNAGRKSFQQYKAMDIIRSLSESPTRFKHNAQHNNNNMQTETTDCDEKIFVFSFQINNTDHFFVRSFDEIKSLNSEENLNTNSDDYRRKYVSYQKVAHLIKYVGFSILTVMVLETLLKISCLGTMFLKKKIEVFDACIVFISFGLDLVFIDSKWYETEKDATTILVLLLPWRVVRILNSFLMTINHKHHIEMMIVRRSKKKVDTKLKKLKQLTLEMKMDMDLLINLAKLKGASQGEIVNCIYSSRGRGTKSLAAITGLASLMFISTLGKTPNKQLNQTPEHNENIFHDLLREILSDDETDADQTTTESNQTKDIYSSIEQEDDGNDIFVINPPVTSECTKRKRLSKMSQKQPLIRRRVTLPRRHRSCSDDKNECYDNNGYENSDEGAGASLLTNEKRSVKSLSNIDTAQDGGNNILTFEFTTQVSYL